jgi:prepilin-type N-terminal cleavage/methylation domain-containing protein
MDARENTQLDVPPLTLTLSPEYEGEGTRPRHVSRFTFHSGFTLAEMSVSLFVIGVIVVTVGSSMTLMLRAAANNRNPLVSGATSGASTSAQAAVARGATDMLVADLKVATGVTTSSSGGGLTATLIVPGRYGSNTTETIVYSWTGAGASLMRKLNSSTAVSIADNVQSFSLPTLTRTVGTGSSSTGTTSSYTPSPGGSSTSTLSLSSTSFAAEYIPPPASATSWSITSVVATMLGTNSGNVTAQIYAVDAGNVPLGSALGTASVAGSTIPKTAGQVTFTFSPAVSGLSPSQGYAVVVFATATGTKVQYNTAGTAATMSWTTSTNAGSTWATPVATSGMVVTVNGTVTQ